MDPAVFLDRDGVIIENVATYVRSWEEVEFFASSLKALRALARSPYKIVIVTNQSAVGRGILSPAQASQISQKIVGVIEAAGGRVDGVFMCPHAPQDNCACRKPRPGLFLQAAQALSIDLARSIMIGDALSDLQAGQAAGILRNFLVQTGRGAEQMGLPLAASLAPFQVCPNLEEAVNLLLNSRS